MLKEIQLYFRFLGVLGIAGAKAQMQHVDISIFIGWWKDQSDQTAEIKQEEGVNLTEGKVFKATRRQEKINFQITTLNYKAYYYI